MTDNELCKALEGTGEVLFSFSVFCIKRDGYLLLALPADKETAKLTLALYHPQSMKARGLVWLVSMLISLRLHRLLPRREFVIRESVPLAELKNRSHQIGFLMGNAQADARRAIVVHPVNGEFDSYVVDKIGFGPMAKRLVLEEISVIESLPKGRSGIPQIRDQGDDDEWAYYSTLYLEGHAPKESEQDYVLAVLQDWMENAELMPLAATEQWEMIKKAVAQQGAESIFEQLSPAGDLKIKVGLFHGDFAPWNIKVSPDGFVNVMDWEHGSPAGPAGWDWLHYIIQRAILVDHCSTVETLEVCRSWAKSREGKEFLNAAGWGDYTELWVGSYLMYSGWVAGFDREDLLRVWGSEMGISY